MQRPLSSNVAVTAGAGAAGLGLARSVPASALFTTSRVPSVVLPPTTVDFVAPAVVDGVGLVATLGCGTAAPVGIVAWPRANPSRTTFSGLTLTHPGPTGLTNTARVVVPGVGIDGRAWSYYPVADWYGSGPAVAGPTWTLPRRPPAGRRSHVHVRVRVVLHLPLTPRRGPWWGTGHQFFAISATGRTRDSGRPRSSPRTPTSPRSDWRSAPRPPLGAVSDAAQQIRDDHDDGQDGACLDPAWPLGVPYPTPGTHNTGFKDYALRAQAAIFPECQYPAPSYRAWSIGEVDFILLDSRLSGGTCPTWPATRWATARSSAWRRPPGCSSS